MELKQLRCLVAVAEELHFGRAAQRLNMLPSALSRQIRLLEERVGARLLMRTTREVAITAAGQRLVEDARDILARAQAALRRAQQQGSHSPGLLRIGAIDSAAAGLLPQLIYAFQVRHPGIQIEIVEGKSARIIPMLIRRRLDLALVRPPIEADGVHFEHLLHENPMAVLPQGHPLARRRTISASDLALEPMILPPRRTSPHSHGMVMRLFADEGLNPHVVQEAEDKQTMINLVAAKLGVAVVPAWMERVRVAGVVYRPMKASGRSVLDEWALGAAWLKEQASPARDRFLELIRELHAPGGSRP